MRCSQGLLLASTGVRETTKLLLPSAGTKTMKTCAIARGSSTKTKHVGVVRLNGKPLWFYPKQLFVLAIESIVLKPSRGGRRDSLDPRNSHDARQVALSTVNMRRAGVDKPTGRPTGTGNKENVTGATNGNCPMYMNYYSNVRQQRTSLPTASQCPTTPTNPSYPSGPSTSRIPTRSSPPRARYNDRESTTAFEKKEGLDQRKRPRLSDSNIPTASGSTGNKPSPNLRLGHSKSEEVKP